jgi:DNA-binding MarR family transcriptional regulator
MGLTAARFDLLYLLAEGRRKSPRRQRALVKNLGVTPPVVSRMLKSLRELGLVNRERDGVDRRGWLVSLTAEGRRRILRAIYVFIRRKHAWKHVQQGLCSALPDGDEREDTAFWLMCSFEELLDRWREGMCAGGALYYPWHPDD